MTDTPLGIRKSVGARTGAPGTKKAKTSSDAPAQLKKGNVYLAASNARR